MEYMILFGRQGDKKAKRMENDMKNYDVSIIGAGPGGIFAAYELAEKAPDLKIAVF